MDITNNELFKHFCLSEINSIWFGSWLPKRVSFQLYVSIEYLNRFANIPTYVRDPQGDHVPWRTPCLARSRVTGSVDTLNVLGS